MMPSHDVETAVEVRTIFCFKQRVDPRVGSLLLVVPPIRVLLVGGGECPANAEVPVQ